MNYPSTDKDTDPYMKPNVPKALSPKLLNLFRAAYSKKGESKNPLVSPSFASIEQLKKFPATLVITAELDSLADEAELFKNKLIEAGVNVSYKKFMGCSHGFTHMKMPEAEKAWQLLADFLRNNLF